MLKTSAIIGMLMGLSGCSSVLSIENPNKASNHGLGYFMPKKDFMVTVVVGQSPSRLLPPSGYQAESAGTPSYPAAPVASVASVPSIASVRLSTTEAYPDLSKNYVLKHGTNAFGRSTLDIRINEKGLLVSAQSDMKSGISDIVSNRRVKKKNLPHQELADPSDKDCSVVGSHTFIHKSVGTYIDCGITITITQYGAKSTIDGHSITENNAASGIFYRQNHPYLMKAVGKGIRNANIVFSPSASKVRFLPIAKTFFAKNKTDFRFKDGVPSKYQQGTDGEVVALFKLPADIIKAYTGAVGAVFDSFKEDSFEYAAPDAEQRQIAVPQ